MKRKYADGGIVVSRGYDAGLGNIRLTDDLGNLSLREPAAARAAADMAINEEVAAPAPRRASAPTRRAAAAPAPAPAPAPRRRRAADAGMSDAEIRAFMRENDRAADASMKKAPVRRKASVSRTGLVEAINRGVGSIDDQMSTQARNMAERRKKNPDIFTRLMALANPYKKAKGGLVKKEKAEMMKKAAGKKAMPMAAMMKKTAKKPMKMAMGGKACGPMGKKK
jgi:hypothetical protein